MADDPLGDTVASAFRRREELRRVKNEATQDDEEALRKQLVKKYRGLLDAMTRAIVGEFCKAINAGKSGYDVGVWHRPYHLDSRPLKPTFTSPPDKNPSCLVPIFVQAAAENEIDACHTALREWLAAECPNITLFRQNILERVAVEPTERHPKRDKFSFRWELKT